MAFSRLRPNTSMKHIYTLMYPWKSKLELASYLEQNIIYHSDDIIAMNKPCGVGVRIKRDMSESETGGKRVDTLYTQGAGCNYTLEDTLPILREQLSQPDLIVVKSAEKYHSGVALFAGTSAAANRIKTCVRSAKPRKKFVTSFHIVSPFTPSEGGSEPFEERVGVRLCQITYRESVQPVVERNITKSQVAAHNIKPSRVKFSLMGTGLAGASLIEVAVSDTSNSFLRVYCADMLMPILGDHLFSHRYGVVQDVLTRLNPLNAELGRHSQKLPSDIRSALELRHHDSSVVPLHAHLHCLALPDFFGKNKDLEITAPAPEYFKWTCKKLELPLGT